MHGLDLLEAAGIGWDVFELDSYEERGFGDMNHGIALFRTRDPPVAGPCEQLTAPLWPADESLAGRLPLTLPTIGGGQHDQGQHEDDKHLNRPVGLLRRSPQVSLLLTRYQAAVLGQTAVIIVVEEPRRLVDRDLGSVQEGGAPFIKVPSSIRYTPATCCLQYRCRDTRVLTRPATAQHNHSARLWVSSSYVCPMVHLPPLRASQL